MVKMYRFINKITVVGLILSFGSAIGLFLLRFDNLVSFVVGLFLAIVTMQIDLIANIGESEKQIIDAFTLSDSLRKDPELLEAIHKIADGYDKSNSHLYDIFKMKARKTMLECCSTFEGLGKGRMTIDVRSELSFGRKGIQNVKSTLKATQYADPSYWRTRHGQMYSEANSDAIKRGVKITRIWIQNKEKLHAFRDVIQEQEKMGVEVFVVEPDSLPRMLLEDYLIADDSLLIKQELILDGETKAEYVTIDDKEIQAAKDHFDLLLRSHAVAPDEYFQGGRNT